MDRLEEYIKKNKEDLDIYNPSPASWRRIRRGLNSGRLPARLWISVAASAAILIATSVIFYQIGKGGKESNIGSVRGLDNVNQQLKEAEAYYNNQVQILYHEAVPLLTGNPELERELNHDLTQIDSIYASLRKDLRDNVANQEVVEALIRNYLIKIEILEEMLAILKENDKNSEKNKSYEL